MLTLGQAAKHTGLSKSTISRAISTGKLSVFSKNSGGYSIDPSELFRVFPSNRSDNGSMKRSTTQTGTGTQLATNTETVADNAALKAELAGLRAIILKLEDQIADLKQQRDRWQEQAQSSQRLLVDMRPRSGFFGFLKRSS